MGLPIITADQRMREKKGVKLVLLGKSGIGKTTQLKTLPEDKTLFVDLEAGDLAVKDWRGDCVRPTTWPEFRDLERRSAPEADVEQLRFSHGIEQRMAGAFQLINSKDLVWSKLVHEYLMGAHTPVTPLRAWNADATRLPARIAQIGLRDLHAREPGLAQAAPRIPFRPGRFGALWPASRRAHDAKQQHDRRMAVPSILQHA